MENKPLGKFSDVPIRVRSWGYIIIIFSLGIINEITMLAFITFLLFQSWREIWRMRIFGKWWIFLWLCISFFHWVLIRFSNNGWQLMVFLVVITELNDIFQYLSGKILGKTKLVPNISPNKTLEGLIGGISLSILASIILGYLLFSLWDFVVLGLLGVILSLVGFGGDLWMSFLKRKAGIKDTGNLIPGHGGLLDRVDSLLFNAPLFYWFNILIDEI